MSGPVDEPLEADDFREAAAEPLARLLSLRQHRRGEQRSPHKPLLVLLALGRLAATGSSEVPWSVAERELADLIAEFGPPSRTRRAQSAAYPFTRLRSDGVWTLDHDVPHDQLKPLTDLRPTGRLEASLEAALRDHPDVLHATARELVDDQFPATIMSDVLDAVGLDPDAVRGAPSAPVVVPEPRSGAERRRDPRWRAEILMAWDRQCAFCGFDGELRGGLVGVEAAHVQWWGFGGPDTLDNGLALCVLHHKLFDLGALGVAADHTVRVSASYSARTAAGRAVYDLLGRRLTPRRGTRLPAERHLVWHEREVFKAPALVA